MRLLFTLGILCDIGIDSAYIYGTFHSTTVQPSASDSAHARESDRCQHCDTFFLLRLSHYESANMDPYWAGSSFSTRPASTECGSSKSSQHTGHGHDHMDGGGSASAKWYTGLRPLRRPRHRTSQGHLRRLHHKSSCSDLFAAKVLLAHQFMLRICHLTLARMHVLAHLWPAMPRCFN